ncbi:MAG: T9SS type A sorting domain-containing protein [Saprospiraceae bacterium]|nr:T9SS type A sorting domain-containing protein [Saprospiraceae bacterium]
MSKPIFFTIGLLGIFSLISGNILAQTNTSGGGTNLAGVPNFVSIESSYAKSTNVTYALPEGMEEDDVELFDRVYLVPKSELWKMTVGIDASGMKYRVRQNLTPHPEEATLEYKISHIVSNDTCMEFYDSRNMLIRHTSYVSDTMRVLDTLKGEEESDDWDLVEVLGPGITRYTTTGLVVTEDLNTGNVTKIFTAESGEVIKFFENRAIENDELTYLNYSLMAIPMKAPSGLCVTKLISDKYYDRYRGGSEKRERNGQQSERIDNLSINPNPVINELNVYGNSLTEGSMYGIYNLSGRKVSEGKIMKTGKCSVDVHNLPSGIYIFQLKSKGKPQSEKFIKL